MLWKFAPYTFGGGYALSALYTDPLWYIHLILSYREREIDIDIQIIPPWCPKLRVLHVIPNVWTHPKISSLVWISHYVPFYAMVFTIYHHDMVCPNKYLGVHPALKLEYTLLTSGSTPLGSFITRANQPNCEVGCISSLLLMNLPIPI